MSFAYSIDPDHRLIYVRFSGHLDLATLSTAREAIRGDPLFQPTFVAFADVTAVDAHDLQWDDMLQIGSQPGAPGGVRIAIVARSPAQVDVARVFTALRSTDDNILVTPYVDEAVKFLRRYGWLPPGGTC